MLRSWFVNVNAVRPCSQCTLPKVATDSISRKQKQIAAVSVKSNRRAGIKKTKKKSHGSGVSKRVDGSGTKPPPQDPPLVRDSAPSVHREACHPSLHSSVCPPRRLFGIRGATALIKRLTMRCVGLLGLGVAQSRLKQSPERQD